METNQHMIIREEKREDFRRIAEVHADAFYESTGQEESVLTALLRQEKGFTPKLSLVAQLDNEIAGHVLVVPYTFHLYGLAVRGGILAPIGVKRKYQYKGVGSRLMEAVHVKAGELNLSFILLLGHEKYYTRFGYETNMFGEAALAIQLNGKSAEKTELTLRKISTSDLPALMEMWEETNRDVPLILKPEKELTSWLSTNKDILSLVYEERGRTAGFVRIHKRTKEIKMFLSHNEQYASQMAGALMETFNMEREVIIPVHPKRKNWFNSFSPSVKMETWNAAMICPVGSDESVKRYITTVKHSPEKAGSIIWPVAFEAI